MISHLIEFELYYKVFLNIEFNKEYYIRMFRLIVLNYYSKINHIVYDNINNNNCMTLSIWRRLH